MACRGTVKSSLHPGRMFMDTTPVNCKFFCHRLSAQALQPKTNLVDPANERSKRDSHQRISDDIVADDVKFAAEHTNEKDDRKS